MAKVVVVEDDVLLAKMYTKLLDFEKHQTVVVNNGEMALETIKKEQPNIVLMDVMMPRMNGLQALEQLKADPETANIPVVVMSNLVNVNKEEEVIARGAVKYIDKSQYDPKKISVLVNEVLAETGETQVSQAQPAQPEPATPTAETAPQTAQVDTSQAQTS